MEIIGVEVMETVDPGTFWKKNHSRISKTKDVAFDHVSKNSKCATDCNKIVQSSMRVLLSESKRV